jgi:D-xylose transport system permease protein
MSNEMQGAPSVKRKTLRSRRRCSTAAMSASSTRRVSGAVAAFVERVRSGDLGSLPVIAGLVIIWTVFTSLNPVFLSANNLVNLLFDCSTVGVISLGIVCVLMVGQIDLSVGSMSGFASAMVGMLWVNHGWPVLLAIAAAIVVGALVGAIYALLLNRLGMPSFVATLAGLLAILGMQLYVLGATGRSTCPTTRRW